MAQHGKPFPLLVDPNRVVLSTFIRHHGMNGRLLYFHFFLMHSMALRRSLLLLFLLTVAVSSAVGTVYATSWRFTESNTRYQAARDRFCNNIRTLSAMSDMRAADPILTDLLKRAARYCGFSWSSAASSSSVAGQCRYEECGPTLGMRNWICPDGSNGGPLCTRRPDGQCGYVIQQCPPNGSSSAMPSSSVSFACPTGKHPQEVCAPGQTTLCARTCLDDLCTGTAPSCSVGSRPQCNQGIWQCVSNSHACPNVPIHCVTGYQAVCNEKIGQWTCQNAFPTCDQQPPVDCVEKGYRPACVNGKRTCIPYNS